MDNHDATNYSDVNKKLREEYANENKFEKIEDRTDRETYSIETWQTIYQGKYKTRWRGLSLIKDPFTIVTYQQLLWDVKPRTVIEIGANTGGSAVWMADTLKVFGVKAHVYSMDIDLDLLEPLAREKRDDITFIQGDCYEPEKSFPPEFLKKLPHPWFFTEDAHVNVMGVVEYFDQFTEPGDYVVVEDTSPNAPNSVGAQVIKELEYVPWGREKLDIAIDFMKKHSTRYRVDTTYTDFFGYNGSANVNSIMRRI